MNTKKMKQQRQIRRKRHIRHSIYGTPDRLRLTVFRSLKHIYAQIINDEDGKTLVSASTMDKSIREQLKPDMNKTQLSKIIGTELGKRALENNITTVAFDRNGYLFHGRVKALADAARKAGLKF